MLTPDLNDYGTFDGGLPICATEDKETVGLLESMNSDSDAQIDNKTLIKTVTIFYALHCLETGKTNLMQQDINEIVFPSQRKVEKKIFRVGSRKDFLTSFCMRFQLTVP
ncbi:hypothetical protein TNCV_321431 [Trichonephila clavipes]|nr:hypothetical protein TNCV_321431 [Trichonephila clavipes]